MPYRDRRIQCVVDGAALEPHGAGSRAFLMCGSCSGQWVSLPALGEMIKAMNFLVDVDHLPVVGASARRCPECGETMQSSLLWEIQLDLCPRNHGVWCDYQELQRVLQKVGRARRIDETITLVELLAETAHLIGD